MGYVNDKLVSFTQSYRTCNMCYIKQFSNQIERVPSVFSLLTDHRRLRAWFSPFYRVWSSPSGNETDVRFGRSAGASLEQRLVIAPEQNQGTHSGQSKQSFTIKWTNQKWNTGSQHKAREKSCGRAFISDWFKQWREILYKSPRWKLHRVLNQSLYIHLIDH